MRVGTMYQTWRKRDQGNFPTKENVIILVKNYTYKNLANKTNVTEMITITNYRFFNIDRLTSWQKKMN